MFASNPFRNAINALQEKGWTRGRAVTSEGNLCFVGALMYSNFEHGEEIVIDTCDEEILWKLPYKSPKQLEYNQLVEMAGKKVKALTGDVDDVVIWNDEYAKDADEVIHVMKELAEDWDQNHPQLPL